MFFYDPYQYLITSLEAVLDDSFGSDGALIPTTKGTHAATRVGGRYETTPLSSTTTVSGLLGDSKEGMGGDGMGGNVVVLRALQNEAAGVIQQSIRAYEARKILNELRQADKLVREEAEMFLVRPPPDIMIS